MNSATWPTIGGLAIATALIKAFGPVIFGGRTLPRLLARTIPLLAAALLAALVLVETFGSARSVTIDARAAGLAAAAVSLALRAPLVVVAVSAAAAAALVRAIT